MKSSVKVWAWCVLCLFNCVNSVHLKNSKYFDYLAGVKIQNTNNINSENDQKLGFYQNNTNHNRIEIVSNKTRHIIETNDTTLTQNETSKLSTRNNTQVVLSKTKISQTSTSPQPSSSFWSKGAVLSIMSHLQNFDTFFANKKYHDKPDVIKNMKDILLKMYKEEFEDKNQFQFLKNDLQGETRMGKVFVPIMYILGVTTTMMKVLMVLTFKAVVIGSILLLVAWTKGIKKKHYHPEPVYHYRMAPKPMTYAMCPLGDPHLCAELYQEQPDYYEEPVLQGSPYGSYPNRDLIVPQTMSSDDSPMEINLPVPNMYSSNSDKYPMYPTNAERYPMYSLDGEKNSMPMGPLAQESTNNEVVEKYLHSYPNNDTDIANIFLTPQTAFITTEAPTIFIDPSFLSDPTSPEFAYEMDVPQTLSSYAYPRRPYYRPGYRRYPYKGYPNKRRRVKKKKDRQGHYGYGKSRKRGHYYYPIEKRNTKPEILNPIHKRNAKSGMKNSFQDQTSITRTKNTFQKQNTKSRIQNSTPKEVQNEKTEHSSKTKWSKYDKN